MTVAAWRVERSLAFTLPPKSTRLMKTKTTLKFAAAALSLAIIASAAEAAPFINGSIQMNSVSSNSDPSGVVFQDALGFETSSLANAAGVMKWNQPVVISASGHFATSIQSGDAVSFAEPWVFADPYSPLWEVGGFSFNITSSVVIYNPQGFLAVEGTGYLSAAGYADTPGFWVFLSQGNSAANGNFSWNSTTHSVPDGGATVALLGLSLLGLHGVRRKVVGH